MLVDREELRKEVGRRTGWLVLASASTSAGLAGGSTLIDTAAYSSARDQHITVRSPVNITESGSARRGERRLATGTPDSSGTITVSPVFGGTVATSTDYEVWQAEGPHPDEIDRCLDRALQTRCWYWRSTPVTDIRGGDVGDELSISSTNIIDDLANTLFTGTTATPTLVSLDPPDEFTRRAIRNTASGANGYLQSATLSVDPSTRGNWYVAALVRLQGSTAATISVIPYDVTNSAAITLSPTDALQWTYRGWGLVDTQFTLPETCDQLSFRLNVSANLAAGEFAWIQAWPTAQTRFSMPRRVATKGHIGPVFQRSGQRFGEFQPVPWRGSLERRDAMGRGSGLALSEGPGSRSLWFYEKVSYPALTSATPVGTDDDVQTWAAKEWVVRATILECYEYLQERDARTNPGRWDEQRERAAGKLISAQGEYGIEPMLVEDSARPVSSPILRI